MEFTLVDVTAALVLLLGHVGVVVLNDLASTPGSFDLETQLPLSFIADREERFGITYDSAKMALVSTK
jgi:hypothetical protein